jgi:DNA-binding response OmpR family regulator
MKKGALMAGSRNGLKHVLLVEDEHDIAIMLRRVLEERQYYVTFTPRLAQARAVLERVRVDLVIANVILPDGTGMEAVDLARQRDIPFLLMTGSVEHMIRLEDNGTFYLAKPFRLIEFLGEVESRLGPARA